MTLLRSITHLRVARWRWTWLGLASGAAVTVVATCKPPGAPPPPPVAQAPLVSSPCPATLVTDVFTDDGIDTRTGCLVVTMPLGSVAGANDLSIPVALVRNEGNAPPPELYPGAWLGLGVWLSIDEYVTRDDPGVYTLHTANGTVVYDFPVKVPDWQSVDPKDDSKTPLYDEIRTRPFDGTFLWEGKNGIYITVGNPGDSRSLLKKYQGTLPGAGANGTARLLTRLEKASIYKGARNYIDIKRTYGKDAIGLKFATSLYDGTGIEPLVIDAPVTPAGGAGTAGGYQISAVTTLLHMWTSTVTALVDGSGNVTQLSSNGRDAGETRTTTFTYANEATPAQTVLSSILEVEGPPGDPADARVRRSLDIQERAPANSPTLPFAVRKIVDHSRPGADMTHVVSECPRDGDSPQEAIAQHLCFNYADGTSATYEYGGDRVKSQLVHTRDALGRNITLTYNLTNGGGNVQTPVTGFELKDMRVEGNGAQAQDFYYRFDRFSADTYGVPMVGKVSFFSALGDKQVYYRAVFGQKADELNGNRVLRTFDVPRVVAGADGRTRWEYRGIDGFTYETFDEDSVMRSYRWVDQDKGPDGFYVKETIETSLMGVLQSRETRDRFGRLLTRADFDPSLPAASQPTLSYHVTPEGFTDRVDDTGSGETFSITGWNGPRSVVTSAAIQRNMKTVSSFSVPADDFGNPDGAGFVTLGPVKLTMANACVGGGLFKSTSLTGATGQTLQAELGYAAKDTVPNLLKMNGEGTRSAAPKAMTADGGCQ